MTKHFSKFPRIGTDGHIVVFGNDNWAAAEEVYGNQLPKEVRDLLSLATLYLTLIWPEEQSAPRLDGPTTKHLTQLVHLAEQLRSELFPPYYWLPEYQDYRPRSAKANVQLALAEVGDDDELALLRVCLTSVIDVGDIIDRRTCDETFGHQDGHAWSMWVVLITLIMKSHQLPSGVRGSSSPFVRLIKYLQTYALQGKKPTHSDGGLSKAIQRARDSITISGDIEKHNVEEFIYELLGIPKFTTLRYDATAMDYMVNWVLGRRDPGIYPVSPEPHFYSGTGVLPLPAHLDQQAVARPKRRTRKRR